MHDQEAPFDSQFVIQIRLLWRPNSRAHPSLGTQDYQSAKRSDSRRDHHTQRIQPLAWKLSGNADTRQGGKAIGKRGFTFKHKLSVPQDGYTPIYQAPTTIQRKRSDATSTI